MSVDQYSGATFVLGSHVHLRQAASAELSLSHIPYDSGNHGTTNEAGVSEVKLNWEAFFLFLFLFFASNKILPLFELVSPPLEGNVERNAPR